MNKPDLMGYDPEECFAFITNHIAKGAGIVVGTHGKTTFVPRKTLESYRKIGIPYFRLHNGRVECIERISKKKPIYAICTRNVTFVAVYR